jgi:hypothetical protein
MSLAKAGMDSGSREENAIKHRESIRSHSVGSENALIGLFRSNMVFKAGNME